MRVYRVTLAWQGVVSVFVLGYFMLKISLADHCAMLERGAESFVCVQFMFPFFMFYMYTCLYAFNCGGRPSAV